MKSEQRTEPVDVKGTPYFVGVGLGVTVNIGNYESVRVDEWAECACTKADREKVRAELKAELRKEISDDLAEVRGKKSGGGEKKGRRK